MRSASTFFIYSTVKLPSISSEAKDAEPDELPILE